jgi:HSP20 family molecular chaperone IbpA
MPKGADLDNAHASLENGVLSVSFPKLQLEDGARGTRIPITSSASSSSSLKK